MDKQNIPEGWKKIKLKEVLTEVNERNKEQKVKRVLSVTNSQGFVNQEDYFDGAVHSADISNYKIIRKNQFAYNPSRVNVGSIDILKDYDEGVLSPMYVVFKVDESKLSPDYFKYYFQTYRFFENVKNNTQGSVRNSLSFKALIDFDYLLPTLKVQERIVKILNKIDKIITDLQKEIEIKKIIKGKVFQEFIRNKKCNKVKLKDLVSYKKGYAFSSKEYTDRGCRIIRVSDLENDKISDICQKKYINTTKKDKYIDYELKKGDVIVTTVGSKPPIYSSIAGRAIKVDSEHEGTLLNQNTVRLRVKKEILSEYLYEFLKTKKYYNYLEIIMRGNANQGNITVEELLNYKIKVISINEQKVICKYLKIVDAQIDLLVNKKDKYFKLNKAIRQRLLTGKVKI